MAEFPGGFGRGDIDEASAVIVRTTPDDVVEAEGHFMRWMGAKFGWCLVKENKQVASGYEIIKSAAEAAEKEEALQRMREQDEEAAQRKSDVEAARERLFPGVVWQTREEGEVGLRLHGIDPGEEGYATAVRLTEVFSRALALAVRKNRLYRDAWRDQGVIGNTARILGKTARLRAMVWTNFPTEDADEPVRDTLLDLVNLGAFAMLNHEGGNRWGNR